MKHSPRPQKHLPHQPKQPEAGRKTGGRKTAILGAICVAIGLMQGTALAATIVKVDLNDAAGSGGPGAGTWNTYAAPTDINGSAMLDYDTGLSSGLTLSRAGTITDSATSGTSTVFNNTSPNSEPLWATSASVNSASGDYFFTSTAGGSFSFTLTIAGLTAGDIFSMDLLASRNEASIIGTVRGGRFGYSLDGGTTWLGFQVLNSDGTVATASGWDTTNTWATDFQLKADGYDNHRYMHIGGVTLTGSTLQIRVMDDAGGGYNVLNAFQLNVVPEPSSLALLLIGCAIMAKRPARRRTV